jgi:hypothetical protein
MVLKRFEPDTSLYDHIFDSNQVGHGALGRYRGSDLQNGAGLGSFLRGLFSRVARFATPLVRSAAPHVKAGFTAATPHLREAAQSVLTEAGSALAKKVGNLLDPTTTQTGSGRAPITKKKKQKPKQKRRSRKTIRITRLPPYDVPDSF